MREPGAVTRALELQRLVEDKVCEWRERSARVARRLHHDAYQPPVHFKRHNHRRKHSAEINRIIAKYSRDKRPDERHSVLQPRPDDPPRPPDRPKRRAKLSRSEDNLASLVMDHPEPAPRRTSTFSLSKYNTKSCEDITAFVDLERAKKSKLFEEKSILNTKTSPNERPKLHSIGEDILDVSNFSDSVIDVTLRTSFVTSTPVSNRKTCPPGDAVSVLEFDKCSPRVSDLKKGSSEPDIVSRNSVDSAKTLDSKKRWSLLKPLKRPAFRKSALDFFVRWRKKSHESK